MEENIGRFSYIDLVIWRNEMITSGAVNNRVFHLLNNEIERRAKELHLYEQQTKNSK